MAGHKLPKGAKLIRGVEALGRVLGYHVCKEFPVYEGLDSEAQAVDVAWFGDAEQPYPLMIFEVESRPSNTIASNPLKVFAQDNREFEKPLFFFHLLASGGQSTTRVAQLERQYGTYNYRLYRFARDEGTSLVKDIVAQHRRISRELDYVKLYEVLQSADWSGLVDGMAIVDHARELGLRRDQVFPSIIRLARRHEEVASRLSDHINAEQMSGWTNTGGLASWCGKVWGPMILSAWMCGHADAEADAVAWEEHLLRWQNHASFMPMFNAELALSHDYAEFMLGLGGPFAAFVVGLAKARGTFGPQLCGVLLKTLNQLREDWQGLQLAAWTLHLSARLSLVEEYEAACTYIDAAGGLAAEDVLTPPSCVDVVNSSRKEEFRPWDGSTCPTRTEFVSLAQQTHAHRNLDRREIMLSILDDDRYQFVWNRDVLAALWGNSRQG